MVFARQHLFTVAFDFGTSTLQAAYSFFKQVDGDPSRKKIKPILFGNGFDHLDSFIFFDNHASAANAKVGIGSPPRCTLGKNAWQKYNEEAADDEEELKDQEQEWSYYENFKMFVYADRRETTSDKIVLVRQSNGEQPMNIITVFASVLQHLKEQTLGHIERTIGLENLQEDQIKWVITVPAIWDEYSKNVTRKSAEWAGMTDITFAKEPEVAALQVRQEGIGRNGRTLVKGQYFMVVDLGGGTADITCYKVVDDRLRVAEVARASGGAWGSTYLNKAFIRFLEEVFGKETLDYIRKQKNGALQQMLIDAIKEAKEVQGENDICQIIVPPLLVPMFNTSTPQEEHQAKDPNKKSLDPVTPWKCLDKVQAFHRKHGYAEPKTRREVVAMNYRGSRIKITYETVMKHIYPAVLDAIMNHLQNLKNGVVVPPISLELGTFVQANSEFKSATQDNQVLIKEGTTGRITVLNEQNGCILVDFEGQIGEHWISSACVNNLIPVTNESDLPQNESNDDEKSTEDNNDSSSYFSDIQVTDQGSDHCYGLKIWHGRDAFAQLPQLIPQTVEVNEELRKIEHVFLVGGMSKSPIVRNRVKDFCRQNYMKLMCSDKPQRVVVLGAVAFGDSPSAIQFRMSPYTFGTAVTSNGRENVFDIMVYYNQEMEYNYVVSRMYHVRDRNATEFPVLLYRSSSRNPKSVDGVDVQCIGKVVMYFRKNPNIKEKVIRLSLQFGATEIGVTAEQLDPVSLEPVQGAGAEVRTTLDFSGVYEDEKDNELGWGQRPTDKELTLYHRHEINDFVYNKEATATLLLRAVAAAQKPGEITRNAVALIVDISTSMSRKEGSKTRLEWIIFCLLWIIEYLPSDCLLSITVFHSGADLVFPLQVLDKAAKKKAIQITKALTPKGCTNLNAGFQTGVSDMNKNPVAKEGRLAKSVIIFTDGEINYGEDTRDGIMGEFVRLHGPIEKDTSINTISYGDSADATLLSALADHRNAGDYNRISTDTGFKSVADLFIDYFATAFATVAVCIEIHITPKDPSIKILRSFPYNGQMVGNTYVIVIGNMCSEQVMDIGLEYTLPALPRACIDQELFDVEFKYKTLKDEEIEEEKREEPSGCKCERSTVTGPDRSSPQDIDTTLMPDGVVEVAKLQSLLIMFLREMRSTQITMRAATPEDIKDREDRLNLARERLQNIITGLQSNQSRSDIEPSVQRSCGILIEESDEIMKHMTSVEVYVKKGQYVVSKKAAALVKNRDKYENLTKKFLKQRWEEYVLNSKQ